MSKRKRDTIFTTFMDKINESSTQSALTKIYNQLGEVRPLITLDEWDLMWEEYKKKSATLAVKVERVVKTVKTVKTVEREE